jgi:hypothetical protein
LHLVEQVLEEAHLMSTLLRALPLAATPAAAMSASRLRGMVSANTFARVCARFTRITTLCFS